jgi:hypothetical protein
MVDIDVGLSMFWNNYLLSLLRHVPGASVEASLHELSKLACCISWFSYVVAPHVVDSLPQALLSPLLILHLFILEGMRLVAFRCVCLDLWLMAFLASGFGT